MCIRDSYIAPNADRTGPVVIYFNANMQLLETVASAALIRMYHQQMVNVVLFNYRGVGESTGGITRDGVLVDAESVFQYVSVGLRIPEHRIVLHARSIGGGVAFSLARLHPAAHLCSERSFASLRQVIRAVLTKAVGLPTHRALDLGGAAEDGWCCACVRRAALEGLMGLLSWLGWYMECGAEAYLAVTGHKWMLYHPHDTIIPFEVSLYLAVCSRDSQGPPCAFRMLGEADGHNRAMSESEKHWHMQMVLQAVAGSGVQPQVSAAQPLGFSYGSI
eukprot:TRINITY_DN16290_c0_g1_i3.p1 TRINITY_DN16290_c0_g1~~TRINITY_DN16290_c0_g1_i3.p1  ORF type:complete len:276 (-),score=73.58 TRINITY_DN16290_c0_g1_i3:163-990(-)